MKTKADYDAEIAQMRKEIDESIIVWSCGIETRPEPESSRSLGPLGWLIPAIIGFLAAHVFAWILS